MVVHILAVYKIEFYLIARENLTQENRHNVYGPNDVKVLDELELFLQQYYNKAWEAKKKIKSNIFLNR